MISAFHYRPILSPSSLGHTVHTGQIDWPHSFFGMRANYQFILSLLCRPFASRQFISWEIFTCTYVYTVLISSLGPNKLCFRYEEFQR